MWLIILDVSTPPNPEAGSGWVFTVDYWYS